MIRKKDFFRNAALVLKWMDGYLNSIKDYPVRSQVEPGDIIKELPKTAPINPEPIEEILKDLNSIILPGVTHWQHPNYHAYFPANNSIESILGDMLSSTIGAQCMNWISSPAAAELEQRMMEWLRSALALPDEFEGVIQDTASSATFVAILTAREVATQFKSGIEGVPNNLRIYSSGETHSSIEKAVRLAGIGSKNLIKIEVDSKQAMKPEKLEASIKDDIKNGYIPCCVIVTLGTTGTLAVDPLYEIAKICHKYDIWCHVDAAYAGSALILEEYRWMAEGMTMADSFVFNPHKWMFTNFDCSCYYVKNVDFLLKTFEILPEYLKTTGRGAVNDYKDWGIPLGRRFRALKLWFVLRSFGLEGIRKSFRKHIELNHWIASNMKLNPGIELISGPFLNFTSFRFRPIGINNEEELNTINQSLLEELNNRGKCYLTHTMLNEKFIIRFVVGQTYVEQKDVEDTWEAILELI